MATRSRKPAALGADATPVIKQATYDGVSVRVWWTPSDDSNVTGYRIVIAFSDAGVAYTADVSGQLSDFGAVSLSGAINTSVPYTAQVLSLIGDSFGLASLQVPLVTVLPQLTAALYDGTEMDFAWAATVQAAQGYLLKVFSQDSGSTFSAVIGDPTAVRGKIPASSLPPGGLDPAQQWVASVCAQAAGSVTACTAGASLPQPLPTLTIGSAEYQGGAAVVVNWPAVAGNFDHFRIELDSPQDDTHEHIDIAGAAVTNGVLPLRRPLAAGQSYRLRVSALTIARAGVASASRAVVTQAPVLRTAEYDGTHVTLRWQPSGDVLLRGYTLKVISLSSGNTRTTEVAGGETDHGTVDTGALDANQRYVAVVVAQADGAVGAASAQLPLLVAQPQVDAAAYDPQALTVDWQPVAGASAGYVARLLVDGVALQSLTLDDPYASSATFALASPLESGRANTVHVIARTVDGGAARSADLALLVTPPVLQYVSYEGSRVVASWTPLAGVDRYVLRVASPVTGVSYSKTAASGAAANATLDLPGALPADAAFAFTLTAQTLAGTSAATTTTPLPTALPQIATANYDGRRVAVSWAPYSDAAATTRGFRALVIATDSGQTYSKTVDDPRATQTTIDDLPAGGLDPAQHYSISVEALGDAITSVRGAQWQLVPGLPRTSYASYYGGRIVAGWQPAPAPSGVVSGYVLSVRGADDTIVASEFVPGAAATSAVLPMPMPALVAGPTYLFSIAAVSADGAQAAANALVVVTPRPRVYLAQYDGTAVALRWDPPFNPAITGYTLQVLSLSSGQSYTATVGDPNADHGSVALATALDEQQVWTAQVWADGPVAAVSDAVTLVAARAELLAARYDGQRAEAFWRPVADDAQPALTGFEVSVVAAGTVVARTVVERDRASATIEVPADAVAPAIRVAMLGAQTAGRDSKTATLIASAPTGIRADTDAVDGTLTLSWGDVLGAGGYRLQFDDGSAAIAVTPPRYRVPQPPPVNVPLALRIAATGSSDGVALTGPDSAAFALMTAQPFAPRVRYDGAQVTVDWTAVAGASGYRVSVLQDGATTPVHHVDVDGDKTSFAFDPHITDTTKTYTVVVQARSGTGSGPPSPRAPLFTPAWFTSTSPATVRAAFVFPASKLATVAFGGSGTGGQDLTLYLPDIGGGTPLTDLPKTVGPFTLAQNTGGGAATYPYTLSIPASSSAWTFGPEPIRSDVRDSYVEFLKTAETLGTVSWGISTLQQAIARALPQTFQETLYYAYGLAYSGPDGTGNGSVDLRPGMVLRVAFNDYMAVSGSGPQPLLNGYVGASALDYEIGGYFGGNNWLLGFDAFVAQLVANGALAVQAPPQGSQPGSEGGVAEAADLFYPLFRAPFYRLFFPTLLVTPSGIGSVLAAANFALASAPTYAALTTTGNTPGPGRAVAYFRGRAVLKPCIRVTVDGNEAVVPLGTTVGGVLERLGRAPPATAVALTGLRVERAAGPAVFDATAPFDVARTYDVRFDWQQMTVYAPGQDALALPLLHGDRVRTQY